MVTQRRRRFFDALIVGGGPAGLALAVRLGRCMEVALVERRSVGWAKPCAGLLCEEAFDELTSLGVAGYFEKSESVELDVIADGRALPPQSFLNIERRELGAALRAALPPSVVLYEGFDVRLKRRDCGYAATLVPARSGGSFPARAAPAHADEEASAVDAEIEAETEVEIEAPRLVAADGVGSSTRRFLGLVPVPTIGVVQSFFVAKLERALMVLDRDICRDYYYWLVPKAGGAILGTTSGGNAAQAALRDAISRLPGAFDCAEGDSAKSIPAREREYYAISKPERPDEIVLAARGAFLIGEAAGLVMPSSGEGLSSAFASARALAEAIASVPGRGFEMEGAAYREAMRERVAMIGRDAERSKLRIEVLAGARSEIG